MDLKKTTRGRQAISLAGRGVKTVAKASHTAGRMRGHREAGRRSRLLPFLVGAGAGAAAGHLLDPEQGGRRRTELRERAVAKLRGGVDRAKDQAAEVAEKAQDAVAEAVPSGNGAEEKNEAPAT